jgi:hypothetical protein
MGYSLAWSAASRLRRQAHSGIRVAHTGLRVGSGRAQGSQRRGDDIAHIVDRRVVKGYATHSEDRKRIVDIRGT